MATKNIQNVITVIILFIGLLTSCIVNNRTDTIHQADNSEIIIEEQIDISDIEFDATKTILPTTEIITTSTSTPNSELTAQNQLSTEAPEKTVQATVMEKDKLIEFLYSKSFFDETCKLPCLWNFDPGNSTPKEINTFIGKFGTYSELGNYLINSGRNENHRGLLLFVWEKESEIHLNYNYIGEELVEYLILEGEFYNSSSVSSEENQSLNKNYISQYFIPDVLSLYGVPGDVYIAPHPPDPMEDWCPFDIVVFYPENGFLISYVLPNEIVEDQYQGCIDQVEQIAIVTWDPGTGKDLNDVILSLEPLYGDILTSNRFEGSFKSITEISSLEAFTNTYKNNNNQNCIQVPINLWP
ncbi:MAG: hypothetical protein JEZ00_19555 [Anaerolineaceae bacterium]|nr:hypothetical protein [Anaerolineaceae bacterium]